MVVPFIKSQENPNEKYTDDLDSQMGDILTNNILKPDEKVKLYNVALEKYKVNYNNKPESEEISSLNKISNHLESFIKDLKDDKEIKNVKIKDEIEDKIENVQKIQFDPNYYKFSNSILNNTNLDNTGYHEDYFNKSYNNRQATFDNNRQINSPMDIDQSIHIPKSNSSSNLINKTKYSQSPSTPKMQPQDNKLQSNKVLKKYQNTRSNYSPLASGLESNRISQKQTSKENPFTKNSKTKRSPNKFSGKGLANTITNRSQMDCMQRWTSNKAGYF